MSTVCSPPFQLSYQSQFTEGYSQERWQMNHKNSLSSNTPAFEDVRLGLPQGGHLLNLLCAKFLSVSRDPLSFMAKTCLPALRNEQSLLKSQFCITRMSFFFFLSFIIILQELFKCRYITHQIILHQNMQKN